MQTIPVVDLNDFRSADPRRQDLFVKTLGDALVEVGFFAVENHGVSSDLISKAYQDARTFFNLPLAAKLSYEDPKLKGQRGYTGFGKEHAKDSKAPDLKEFWHVGRNLQTDHPRNDEYLKNIWPSEINSFQVTFNSLYSQLDATASLLLQAAARYLNLDENLFSNMSYEGNSILRVIHYPPVPTDRHPASIRAAAHEDINLITLLCESTASGLELLQRDGTWRPIHSLKGQIIADAGDMLQNITNGLYKSTTHRVVNPDNSREERFSMPFFTHPRSECDLSPLKSCIEQTPNHQTKYPNITAGDYLNQRLREIGLA